MGGPSEGSGAVLPPVAARQAIVYPWQKGDSAVHGSDT